MDEKIPSVTKEDVLRSIEKGDAKIIDVLGEESYRKAHIKSAISVPLDVLENDYWKKIPRGQRVIVYCKSYTCNASRNATLFLRSKGIDAFAYDGGISEWTSLGLPTEGELASEEKTL